MKKIIVCLSVIAISVSFFAVSKAKAASANPFDYELVYQSPFLTLKPGQVSNVWIEVKNTGTVTWNSSGIENVVRLGTGSQFDPQKRGNDYDSAFYYYSSSAPVISGNDYLVNWIDKDRPATLSDGINQLSQVKPGWNARFQFTVQAPSTEGVYDEYFTPVVEGVEWMKDLGIYWEITVSNNASQNQNSNNTNSNVSVSSITLSPANQVIVQSGQTEDFKLTANYSDGSSQDVTALAAWDVTYGSGTGTMQTTVPGRFIAGGIGTCWVTASFQGHTIQSAQISVAGL